MLEKFGNRSTSFIRVLSVIILAVILTANMIFTTRVSYNLRETVTYHQTYWYFIPLIILSAVLLYGSGLLDRLSAGRLYGFLSVVYIAAACFIIFSYTDHIRADAATCWSIAEQLMNGDYTSLQEGEYIDHYPFQLGLVTYEMFLRLFTDNERVLYVASLVQVLVINWFGYLTADRLFHNPFVSKLTLVLEFGFLPQFFLIHFGYGTIPGMCCLVVSFYHFICLYQDDKGSCHAVLAVLFVLLASIFKTNYCIGAVAMAIMLILKLLTEQKQVVGRIVLACLMVLLPLSASGVIEDIFSYATEIEIGDGVPITSSIAMGTDLDNVSRAPGWYDSSTWNDYEAGNNDTEETSRLAKSKIRDNIADSLENPGRALKFYGKKIVSEWADPLFESVWSGPMTQSEQSPETPSRILRSLYGGGDVEQVVAVVMKGFLVLVLAAALLFQLRRGREYTASLLLPLYMIGGFIFHFFSEGKSQYTYMYIFVLLPLCACELALIRERFWNRSK